MSSKWVKRGCLLLDEIKNFEPRANEAAAWYIGQVGFVFKGGATVAVDPFLNDLTDAHGNSKRLYEPPFGGAELDADYVLITHGHDDHMALPTLTKVVKARIIAPEGCVDALYDAGIPKERVIPIREGKRLELPGMTVEAVQAAHPVHTDDNDYALCYLIKLNGVSIMHLGDTYLTDRLYTALKSLDTPDALFTPINGGDYFRTARNCIGNMNAIESARLAHELRAAVTVPTHYDLMRGNTTEPYEFMRELRRLDPAARIGLPMPGEKLLIEAEGPRLRKAEAGDIPEVAWLYKSSLGRAGSTWNDDYPTEEDARGDLDAGCLYVYTLNGCVIGAASVIHENELEELECWRSDNKGSREIARVVVGERYAGNGLASGMVAELIKLLRASGARSIRLLAAKKNPAAVATYEKLGFTYLRECRMYGEEFLAGELILK